MFNIVLITIGYTSLEFDFLAAWNFDPLLYSKKDCQMEITV